VVEKYKISAKERDLSKKANKLRREGFIPAVIYSKGKEAMSLAVDGHSFDLCYREAGGNSVVLIEVEKLDGSTSKKNALIHEVDLDPVSEKVLHTDFLQIRMDEKITATVPLSFIGDSVAVIELSGSLLTPIDEIEVECFPADLPHEIEIDITALSDFESVIHISDLKIPEGVAILSESEEVVAYVEPPRSEEEMAELEEPITPDEELPPSEHGEAEPEKETEEGSKEKTE